MHHVRCVVSCCMEHAALDAAQSSQARIRHSPLPPHRTLRMLSPNGQRPVHHYSRLGARDDPPGAAVSYMQSVFSTHPKTQIKLKRKRHLILLNLHHPLKLIPSLAPGGLAPTKVRITQWQCRDADGVADACSVIHSLRYTLVIRPQQQHRQQHGSSVATACALPAAGSVHSQGVGRDRGRVRSGN